MASASLKDLFTPGITVDDDELIDESVIALHFMYGTKHYCTSINDVKEIIDFPQVIPFPVKMNKMLGVFNLRGSIVPVVDPESHLINIQNIHRFKAPKVYERMKLRLIVFEVAPDNYIAFPASEVGKCEIPLEEYNSTQDFVKVSGIPHEKFEIKNIVGNSL